MVPQTPDGKFNVFTEEDIPYLLKWIEDLKQERTQLEKAVQMFEEMFGFQKQKGR